MAADANHTTRVLGDRYRIEQLLGSGGMARVYLATDLHTNQPCALKVLRPDLAKSAELRESFRNEGKALAALDHPNIISVLATGEEDGVEYLVMEHLQESLGAVLKRSGRFAPARAVEIVAGVLRGLEAAHDQKIVHRDLKPGNVMLGLDGVPKITDFGIAQQEGASTSGPMGTASYMAPESRDAASVDGRADVYGAGALLYALLTCKRPAALFQDDQSSARLKPIQPGLREVIVRATRFRADDRYPSAAAMRDDLLARYVSWEEERTDPALEARIVAPNEHTLPLEPRQGIRRLGARLLGAVAALILVALALVAAALR